MSNQYDVPPEKIKLEEQKAERRAFLRNEFLRQKQDPFKHAMNEGGVVFDAAIQRYQALKVSGYEHFKPTPKTGIYAIFAVVLPMVTFGYLVKKQRSEDEARYRRGEVSYRDRKFKFI